MNKFIPGFAAGFAAMGALYQFGKGNIGFMLLLLCLSILNIGVGIKNK